MLDTFQNTLLVFAITVLSLGCLLVLNWFWPAVRRREHNDLIGWQLSILGTTYAVILGFMLYTVWTDYGLAEANVDAEANAITNVYELAAGLPAPQRMRVQALARQYGDVLVEQDWPEMARLEVPVASRRVNDALWQAVAGGVAGVSGTVGSGTISGAGVNGPAADHMMSELEVLTTHRQMRLLQSTSTLPAVLWWVLNMGGTLTLLSTCLFGSLSVRVHALQVASLSLLIGLVLAAIADINRPFQGAVHVGTASVERARDTMRPMQ